MWLSELNGAWPTQPTPSPPMWLIIEVRRSGIQIAMPWQPMPAMARLPSGTRVEVLCGQPEQKNGVRATLGGGADSSFSLASRRARRCLSSGDSPMCFISRPAITTATPVGVSSPSLGRMMRPVSSALPITSGRSLAGMLYSRWTSCSSRLERFSSMTMTSLRPRAKRRAPSGSSGQVMPTLYRRMPISRARASLMPRSSSAWRVSMYALPVVMMPIRALGGSITVLSKPLARTNALTAAIFGPCSRFSASSGGSGLRMPRPPGGSSKSVGMLMRMRSGSTHTEAPDSTVSEIALKPIQQPE